MKFIQSTALTLLVTAGAAQPAIADPTAWPNGNWSLSGLKNQTSSTLLSDSNDPTQVWVLPPNSGRIETPRMTSVNAPNLDYCKQMKDLIEGSRAMKRRLIELSDAMTAQKGELVQAEIEIERLHRAQAEHGAFEGLSQRIKDADARIQQIESQLVSCSQGNADCSHIRSELDRAKNERQDMDREFQKERSRNRREYREWITAVGRTDNARQNAKMIEQRLETTQKRVTDQDALFFELYGKLALIEGGQAQATYRSGWDANIDRLRGDNPTGHAFSKVPTQRARLLIGFAGASTEDSYLGRLPAVRSFSLNGRSFYPYGEQNASEMPALPEDGAISYELNLIGACPIIHPDLYELPKDEQGIPSLNVAATYEYPMMFHSKVRFKYNLYNFFSQMRKTGERGILFWKKAYSELVQKQVSRDAFEVDWTESDPDNVLSDERKREIEKEVKSEMMAQVMRTLGMPTFDGTPPSLPPVPTSGAVVLAQGLESNCFMQSYYCAGAAWALRGLNAIFDNSSSEASIRREIDITVERTWSNKTVRWKPAVSTFISAGRN